MKSLGSYLITIFAIMFWMFRVVVALLATIKVDFIAQPMDMTYEIILLFVTLIALVLVVKRNIIGAWIYFSAYLLYFGSFAITEIINNVTGTDNSAIDFVTQHMNIFFSVLAIGISAAVLIDILFNKNRTNNSVNKKMDWFYQKGVHEREYDERADKNNYRTL